jgi:hypothetical protein
VRDGLADHEVGKCYAESGGKSMKAPESTGAGIGGLCNHHVTTQRRSRTMHLDEICERSLAQLSLWNALASFLPDQTEQCAFNSKDK